MKYDSPREIAQLLRERGLTLKKRFGQNFLISPGVRQKIVDLLGVTAGECVWEIGPGIGSMTHMLLGRVERLVVFEIDHGLVRLLEESLGRSSSLTVVPGDYLKTWGETVERLGAPNAVFGNLPYNAAAPIIASLADWQTPVKRAVLTVQREVARRMAAKPATKEYSSFSLVCQSTFEVRLHGDIAPASFHPVPEVTSTIVSLVPNEMGIRYNRRLFSEIVRRLFVSRRKTVRNNLLVGRGVGGHPTEGIARALDAVGIDPNARGEGLSVRQVIALTAALEEDETS